MATTATVGGTKITTDTGQKSWSQLRSEDPQGTQAALARNNNNAVAAFNDYNATKAKSTSAASPTASTETSNTTTNPIVCFASDLVAALTPNSKQHKQAKALLVSGQGKDDVDTKTAEVSKKQRNWAMQLQKISTDVQTSLSAVKMSNTSSVKGATLSITSSISGTTAGLNKFQKEAVHDIYGWKEKLKNNLKPFSSAIGSTVGSLDNIAKNPLGAPQLLADSSMHLLDKVSPKLANSINGSVKSLHLEHLANLPGQVMGSVRSLALAADSILSVPFTLAADIYNGLLEIMEEIANLIDGAVSLVFNLMLNIVYGLLDSILPMEEIMSFISSIADLAEFVGGVANLAGGFSAVTNITDMVTTYTDNFSTLVNANPLSLVKQYVPGASNVLTTISNITDTLRNPDDFIKGALPPSISLQLEKISNLPGFAFVSDHNASIGDTLNTLKGGVFTKALDNLGKEYSSLLKPLHNLKTGSNDPTSDDLQETYPGSFKDYLYAPKAQGNHGVIMIVDTANQRIFSEKKPKN